MTRISSPRAWRIVAALIGALLLAIVVAGVLAIIENDRVKVITERALSFDLEVEDEGVRRASRRARLAPYPP